MTYTKKLIEVALPLATVNAESVREKSIRQGHPSTLHLWWARRPLASARAVLWASLVDDPSSHPDLFPTEGEQQVERRRLFDLFDRLVTWEAIKDQRLIMEARAEIERCCGDDLPKILDPFGGGGSIPLESLRLGLPTASGDLNPVSVLIQKAMLQVPSRFAGCAPVHPEARNGLGMWEGARGLAADVEAYARSMRKALQAKVDGLYPKGASGPNPTASPLAWIWVRTVRSPDPSWGAPVPLAGSWVILKRPNRPLTWVQPIVDREAKTITYKVMQGGSPAEPTVDRGKGICVATGAAISNAYIKEEALAGRMGAALIAVVVEGDRGKVYLSPSATDLIDVDPPSSDVIAGDMPPAGHGLGFRVQAYGLTSWQSIYSPRQLRTLDALCDLLAEVRNDVLATATEFPEDPLPLSAGGRGAVAYADAVTTFLAFIIDRCAGRWNSLSIWNSVRETIEHVFRMQTVQMTWVYVEANPLSDAGGGWDSQIDWVTKALVELPTGGEADVSQRDARSRIADFDRCVVVTDPPYYDNIGYADLSDLYYTWIRRNLSTVWPDECATLLTPKADELIADPGRAGSRDLAYRHFESGMREFFEKVCQHQDERFPAVLFYAFKATESTRDGHTSTGWETFLQGLLDSGLTVSATWPLRTEMSGGVRNFGRNSLASSIVLACRKRHEEATMATRREFLSALRDEMAPAIRVLQTENIAPVDLAQSAIGPGIAIFSRYAKVVEADGKPMTVRAALGLINDALAEVLSGEESEFDPDTRFALTWFEQFGHNPGPFGDADLLSRAKDTTVAGVIEAGVVVGRDGKVRLVERSELSADWDPATHTRLTVWEITQHLIRKVESSETEAATLLARLGEGIGERARQLAYLLYGVCERKKWADEAAAYNMLVTAWPEISRLAASPASPASDEVLF